MVSDKIKKRLTFEELLEYFNKVLDQRGYKKVTSSMKVYEYLQLAYHQAEDQYNADGWMFDEKTYPLVFDYRKQDNI
jgi:hypothetical protein